MPLRSPSPSMGLSFFPSPPRCPVRATSVGAFPLRLFLRHCMPAYSYVHFPGLYPASAVLYPYFVYCAGIEFRHFRRLLRRLVSCIFPSSSRPTLSCARHLRWRVPSSFFLFSGYHPELPSPSLSCCLPAVLFLFFAVYLRFSAIFVSKNLHIPFFCCTFALVLPYSSMKLLRD